MRQLGYRSLEIVLDRREVRGCFVAIADGKQFHSAALRAPLRCV